MFIRILAFVISAFIHTLAFAQYGGKPFQIKGSFQTGFQRIFLPEGNNPQYVINYFFPSLNNEEKLGMRYDDFFTYASPDKLAFKAAAFLRQQALEQLCQDVFHQTTTQINAKQKALLISWLKQRIPCFSQVSGLAEQVPLVIWFTPPGSRADEYLFMAQRMAKNGFALMAVETLPQTLSNPSQNKQSSLSVALLQVLTNLKGLDPERVGVMADAGEEPLVHHFIKSFNRPVLGLAYLRLANRPSDDTPVSYLQPSLLDSTCRIYTKLLFTNQAMPVFKTLASGYGERFVLHAPSFKGSAFFDHPYLNAYWEKMQLDSSLKNHYPDSWQQQHYLQECFLQFFKVSLQANNQARLYLQNDPPANSLAMGWLFAHHLEPGQRKPKEVEYELLNAYPPSLLQLAELAVDAPDAAKAVIQRFPNHPFMNCHATFWVGHYLFQELKLSTESRGFFDQLVKYQSDCAYSFLGLSLVESNSTQVVQYLKKAVELDQGNAYLHQQLNLYK